MAKLPSTSIPRKRVKLVRDKRYGCPLAPIVKAPFFHIDEEYNLHCSVALKLVTFLKSWDFQLLQIRALKNLCEILEHYKLKNLCPIMKSAILSWLEYFMLI